MLSLLRLAEKKICIQLKWDLNAVNVADITCELSLRLLSIVTEFEQEMLVQLSLMLANVYLPS